MRLSSSPSDAPQPATGGLFDGVLAAGAVRAAVSDGAWVRAMLDAEAALAVAAGRVGLLAARDAAAVAAACARMRPDPAEIAAIGAEAASSGTPVVPLVRRLRAALPASAARAVHLGATSQDIMDTAAMLVAHRALGPLLDDLGAAADLAARLADLHRRTPVTGRTLLQHASPTTFGLVAAGWLTGLEHARRRLAQIREDGLAAQLGGAVGTLAGYREGEPAGPPAGTLAAHPDGEPPPGGPAGTPPAHRDGEPPENAAGTPAGHRDGDVAADAGIALLGAFAAELGLAEPVLPWHTDRTRIADLAGAAGVAAGAAAKVAWDIVLSAQTEVGELAEGGGEGGSSAMPHKHNPIRAISAVASAKQAPGLVATLLSAMPQEHQRAAGGWYAEWRPLGALLEATGSAAHQLRRSLDGLRVDTERMGANLGRTHGALLAGRVAAALRPALGAGEAHEVVREAVAAGRLATDPRIVAHLTPAELDALLDPRGYLGSADALIDRALRAARR